MGSLIEKLSKSARTGHAEFLAVKDEITEAMESGFSRKAIWKALKDDGRISIEYRQFLQYCHRYTGKELSPQRSPPSGTPAETTDEVEADISKKAQPKKEAKATVKESPKREEEDQGPRKVKPKENPFSKSLNPDDIEKRDSLY